MGVLTLKFAIGQINNNVPTYPYISNHAYHGTKVCMPHGTYLYNSLKTYLFIFLVCAATPRGLKDQ